MSFLNRAHAGRLLAERLRRLELGPAPIVIALPRGGVPVAKEVAHELGLPMDILVVRKIGSPLDPEYGLGAITEDGVSWIDWERAEREGLTAADLQPVRARERAELERRVRSYRGERPRAPVEGRTVILVDDGLATGGTARAAARLLRQQGAARLVLAVPVCPSRARLSFGDEVDELVCVAELDRLMSVGQHYEDFGQVTDAEVAEALESATRFPGLRLGARHLVIDAGSAKLMGEIAYPSGARGIVVFAHGSGSSRLSPRNQSVASAFKRAGFGTLLFDLLTPDESSRHERVFDIPLLAKRLELATAWIDRQPGLRDAPVGYFGASTGAAAALWAAAEQGPRISAVVSRGGRPDLAAPRLRAVSAPTLLVVGSRDTEVLALNRRALEELERGKLVVIPGATHLFEESGALEQAASEALEWFERHLGRGRGSRSVA
jgi:putative phosphoribosyl transferase